MGVLAGIEPVNVFRFFEEICGIPHGSGNVRAISDYLKEFAEKRGLFCIQDALYNIIIIKEASAGYEKEAPYILQGHMDMVAVREEGCDLDMEKEGLRLQISDGKIYAQGTSLGGDDGIGVAYCLALLDAQDIAMPRLEVILTVDEETGMEGAEGIDLSMLRGRQMINLDQEEEGIFITSCAGGARVDVTIPMETAPPEAWTEDMRLAEIKVMGLMGGHSGMEINKGRGNANYILGQVLQAVGEHLPVRLVSMQGGVADNAIPREASAVLAVREEETGELERTVREQESRVRGTLGEGDPGVQVTYQMLSENSVSHITLENFPADAEIPQEKSEAGEYRFLEENSVKRALSCLAELPNGVVAMSGDVEGLVETSLNLGVLALMPEGLRLQYAVRSSVDRKKEILCERIKETAGAAGAQVSIRGCYPGWAYRKDSPLREKMVRIYEEMYGVKPALEAIHAGLECGILSGKIEGLDCVSVGPELENVHTAEEKMDIASVKRVWEYLLAVLTRKA